ncbi:MAG: hypothetical protein JSV83_14390, partial [Desulfobacterales bacterium]
LDSKAQLVPEIHQILPIIKQHDMVLASGHMSPAETFALEKEARRLGINRFVVTHPLDHEFFSQAFSKNDLILLAKNGAFIEFTLIALLTWEFRHDPAEMVDVIKTVGAEQCIVSTDLGQIWNPRPVEGLRMFIVTLVKYGVTEDEINLMIKTNPAKLLGLNA